MVVSSVSSGQVAFDRAKYASGGVSASAQPIYKRVLDVEAYNKYVDEQSKKFSGEYAVAEEQLGKTLTQQQEQFAAKVKPIQQLEASGDVQIARMSQARRESGLNYSRQEQQNKFTAEQTAKQVALQQQVEASKSRFQKDVIVGWSQPATQTIKKTPTQTKQTETIDINPNALIKTDKGLTTAQQALTNLIKQLVEKQITEEDYNAGIKSISEKSLAVKVSVPQAMSTQTIPFVETLKPKQTDIISATKQDVPLILNQPTVKVKEVGLVPNKLTVEQPKGIPIKEYEAQQQKLYGQEALSGATKVIGGIVGLTIPALIASTISGKNVVKYVGEQATSISSGVGKYFYYGAEQQRGSILYPIVSAGKGIVESTVVPIFGGVGFVTKNYDNPTELGIAAGAIGMGIASAVVNPVSNILKPSIEYASREPSEFVGGLLGQEMLFGAGRIGLAKSGLTKPFIIKESVIPLVESTIVTGDKLSNVFTKGSILYKSTTPLAEKLYKIGFLSQKPKVNINLFKGSFNLIQKESLVRPIKIEQVGIPKSVYSELEMGKFVGGKYKVPRELKGSPYTLESIVEPKTFEDLLYKQKQMFEELSGKQRFKLEGYTDVVDAEGKVLDRFISSDVVDVFGRKTKVRTAPNKFILVGGEELSTLQTFGTRVKQMGLEEVVQGKVKGMLVGDTGFFSQKFVSGEGVGVSVKGKIVPSGVKSVIGSEVVEPIVVKSVFDFGKVKAFSTYKEIGKVYSKSFYQKLSDLKLSIFNKKTLKQIEAIGVSKQEALVRLKLEKQIMADIKKKYSKGIIIDKTLRDYQKMIIESNKKFSVGLNESNEQWLKRINEQYKPVTEVKTKEPVVVAKLESNEQWLKRINEQYKAKTLSKVSIPIPKISELEVGLKKVKPKQELFPAYYAQYETTVETFNGLIGSTPKEMIKIVQEPRLQIKTLSLEKQLDKLEQNVNFKQENKLQTKYFEKQFDQQIKKFELKDLSKNIIKQENKLAENIGQKDSQKQNLKQFFKMAENVKTKLQTKPFVVNPKIPVPKIPTTKFPRFGKQYPNQYFNTNKVKGFYGEIKSKGKWIKVTREPLTSSAALNRAADRADKTLAQSIRIVESNANAIGSQETLQLGKFKQSKKNAGVFVEKKKFALESLEQKQIRQTRNNRFKLSL